VTARLRQWFAVLGSVLDVDVAEEFLYIVAFQGVQLRIIAPLFDPQFEVEDVVRMVVGDRSERPTAKPSMAFDSFK